MNREDSAVSVRTPKAQAEQKTVEESSSALRKGSVDIVFLLITSALVLFGCVMVYSASSVFAEQHHDTTTYFITRHLIFLLMAVAFTAVIVRFCTPAFWRDFSYPIFGVAILMLLAVLVVGSDLGSGAKRWLDLKIFTIQPSEIAKLALVLIMARFMTDHQKKVLSEYRFGGSFKYGVLFPGLMIGTLGILIAAERHISGLMIVGMIGMSMMFLGGTRLRWLVAIAGVIGCAGCLLVLVSDYAQARVETWLFIEQADPLGEAWQTLQGLMAIGSGGLFGVGLGNSRQKFGYVSQPQNDFIFTIVCEELGFIGAALVVGLFIAFVWRGFRIAKHAPDRCSSLIVYGLVFKVALQTILNLAVVTNSMPNTGIALPFFSYGGTSLMLQIFEVGIILSISRYCTHEKI
ncbi:MAG: cell division protein FtsW [Clostridia bacterium]|nr:cell division protein FtsW [Clostridia bacterium]MBQ5661646.1 cell division protein FtsW [Clostridia bacterium]MBQ5772578.1 cell division protein FtsW [Clostridia bacterium]